AGTSTEKVRLIAELNGQAVVETAAAVTVDAGEASESTSAITLDQASYRAGDDVKVTVTLKDAHDNPVSGQAAVLGDTTVTVRGTSNTP
ncbi:hypothetical protein, partial [Enterobacter ludwigii]|uniref:hypothetical protein n=1 Tax=Enterobacter ludwigii TaxID=299767 RepID=UPI003975DC2A